jgi:hypothetical protein
VDLLAERRLRNVQPIRGMGEVQLPLLQRRSILDGGTSWTVLIEIRPIFVRVSAYLTKTKDAYPQRNSADSRMQRDLFEADIGENPLQFKNLPSDPRPTELGSLFSAAMRRPSDGRLVKDERRGSALYCSVESTRDSTQLFISVRTYIRVTYEFYSSVIKGVERSRYAESMSGERER